MSPEAIRSGQDQVPESDRLRGSGLPGSLPSTDRARFRRRAVWLVTGNLIYNVAEGVLAIWWGAKAQSSALVAFGLDSGIETAAASIVLWRLVSEVRANQATVDRREATAHRFIGWTFIALALYVVIDAGGTLLSQKAPDESLLGIALAAVSLSFMPVLSWMKLRVAAQLGSRALRAEALETLACSYLSATLLFGLGANTLFGWWWADPAAAVLMVPWLIREGREGINTV